MFGDEPLKSATVTVASVPTGSAASALSTRLDVAAS